MKYMKPLLLILIIFAEPKYLFPQQLPDSCLADFYPLNDGDIWQYQLVGPIESLYTRKIVGDTVMSNGVTYKIIEQLDHSRNQTSFDFQRYDSSTFFLFDRIRNKEYLWYELGMAVGEFWPSDMPGLCDTTHLGRLDYIREEEIFDESKTVVSISFFCARDTGLWVTDKLVKGIGGYRFGGEGDFLLLQGAIIKGKQYGIITSVEDKQPNVASDNNILSNYSNPFNASTVIRYKIQSSQTVSVR